MTIQKKVIISARRGLVEVTVCNRNEVVEYSNTTGTSTGMSSLGSLPTNTASSGSRHSLPT